MVNFTYNSHTKIVFGKGTQAQTGALLKEQNATKVLVHYGSERIRKTGLLAEVLASLDKEGIAHIELGGVVPNPHLSLVYEGSDLCKKEGVDFILAIGGGSVIDSAKAIALGATYDGDIWDFYEALVVPTTSLPVGAVLTIAAAGSEVSVSSVITDERYGKKRGLKAESTRCRFAVMNPELTLDLPVYETACGCVDILMHTMERYFAKGSTMDITDNIAEALMRTVLVHAQLLTRNPQNYESRAEIMWAGSLSHNDLTGCGAEGDWACHQLGHEISGKYDTPHGASLSAMWGSWARYVYKQNPARFARFAINVLELPEEEDVSKMALAGIEEMEGIFWGLDMPASLEDLGLDLNAVTIAEMTKGCTRDGKRTIGAFRVLGAADIEKIYELANERH